MNELNKEVETANPLGDSNNNAGGAENLEKRYYVDREQYLLDLSKQAIIELLEAKEKKIENNIKRFWSWKAFGIAGLIGIAALEVSALLSDPKEIELIGWILGGLAGLIGALMYYLIFAFILRVFWSSSLNKVKAKLIEVRATEMKKKLGTDQAKDFFTQLVEINFKYIDQYYLQTQEQADKSFWLSAICAIIGFLLVIAGVIVLYNDVKRDAGFVATSAGVISEFIAAVFFYLYNQTIQKMSQYHQKLVITQNISLALKSADQLTDTKAKVLETIIDRLTTDVNKFLTSTA